MRKNIIGIDTDTQIPGEVSKEILTCIQEKKNVARELLQQYHILPDEIDLLSQQYHQRMKDDPSLGSNSRFECFYHIAKEFYPDIKWENKKNKQQAIVNFFTPLIHNLQPSLLSLLLKRVKITNMQIMKYKPAAQVPQTVAKALEHFLQKTNAIYPDENMLAKIFQWIERAKQSGTATVFMHTCPDYEVEPTGNINCPYKYTFKSLGDDIGQIAQRLLTALPDLRTFFKEAGIKVNIVASIADYEAYSQATLDRVHETKTHFLQKIRKSLDKFTEASKHLDVKTLFFTELSDGDEKSWLQEIKKLETCFRNGDFGQATINKKIFNQIATKRKSLYSRWYGEQNNFNDYLNIAISQAAEYAITGKYINQNFENCLILGADSEFFGPLYNVFRETAYIYLKKKYY